ncbi:MAG: NUDIX hydrolase [Peptostreptococcaceae bacterium]
MDYIKLIEDYIPFNEQESKDKDIILKCIEKFDDVLTRDNEIAHLTSSTFVVNKNRDKVLMVHHNIYNTWSWMGGHNDGDSDYLNVAMKELKEETGVENAKVIGDSIFSIDVLDVKSHMKKGRYVAPHLHLSIAYLVEANENENLEIKEDENSGVMWIDIDKLDEYVKNEPHMLKLYEKFIDKMNK